MIKDETEKVRNFSEEIVKKKLYTRQSKIVNNALRQLFIKYRKEASIEEIRKITRKATEKAGRSLSEEVEALREEIG